MRNQKTCIKDHCKYARTCQFRKRRAQAALLVRNPKRKGELAEMVFLLAAASHGLTVSKPYGDSARYDFLVQNHHRIWRVQVKAAFSLGRHGAYYFRTATGPRPQRCYSEKDIDFMAAYIAVLDLWYILPVDRICSARAMALCPGAQGSHQGARFEPFRDAWYLLTQRIRRPPQESRTDHVGTAAPGCPAEGSSA